MSQDVTSPKQKTQKRRKEKSVVQEFTRVQEMKCMTLKISWVGLPHPPLHMYPCWSESFCPHHFSTLFNTLGHCKYIIFREVCIYPRIIYVDGLSCKRLEIVSSFRSATGCKLALWPLTLYSSEKHCAMLELPIYNYEGKICPEGWLMSLIWKC